MAKTMVMVNSLDKIVEAYFQNAVCAPFTYGDKGFQPIQSLKVSPLVYRDFGCPANCAGCCPRFSLVYIPAENRPVGHIEEQEVEFNHRKFKVYVDPQTDHNGHFCRHVNMNDGRCKIHGIQPFSCDFEILKFVRHKEQAHLMVKKYGRGHMFLTSTGSRGALCEIKPPSATGKAESLRKLRRLKQWLEYFELPHRLDLIIREIEDYPIEQPTQDPSQKTLF